MLDKLKKFAREYILVSLIAALSLGATGGVGAYWALFQSRVNRVEEMKTAEFNALISENDTFLTTLSSFTEEVADSGNVDIEKRKALSASLVRLYTKYGSFKVNLPNDKEQPVQELQTSINEVRKRVQLVNEKADLDPLSVAFFKFAQNMKVVQPILEEAVGKSVSPNA